MAGDTGFKAQKAQYVVAMLSVVCVYNDKQVFTDYLLQSLRTQTAPFELIPIDNTERRFRSAAQALNYGGEKAHGKYILFVHQDVSFTDTKWIKDAEGLLDSLPTVGIAGVAGAGEQGTISNVTHGTPPKPASITSVTTPVAVQTLDECAVIIPRRVFTALRFDETVCDDWHLYATDYCLSCQRLGLETMVLPLSAYHVSTGRTPVPEQLFDRVVPSSLSDETSYYPHAYYATLKKVLKKHKKFARCVHTVNGDWLTGYPIALQQLVGVARKNAQRVKR
ncbi:MAG: glycosyltransferase, partial [Halobacteriota archaeon]